MTTSQQTKVYLSGPMFSDGDNFEQDKLADALVAANFERHLPHRDGIEVGDIMQLVTDHTLRDGNVVEPLALERCVVWVTRAVAALDVFQVIEGCQVTVLNIDGRVPDEGSLIEATLAWYAGHPVVPYKTTSISELGGNDNPMIGIICGWAPVSSTPAGVVAAVKAAVKSGAAGRQPVTTPPPDVQQLVELGRVISDIRAGRPHTKLQRAAAARVLAALSPQLMELLEPVPLLQPICQGLVLAAIEYSQLWEDRYAKRRKTLFHEGIAQLQSSMTPGITKAMGDNRIFA
jgi:nucleoside 2-deoxyribosyltransferase